MLSRELLMLKQRWLSTALVSIQLVLILALRFRGWCFSTCTGSCRASRLYIFTVLALFHERKLQKKNNPADTAVAPFLVNIKAVVLRYRCQQFGDRRVSLIRHDDNEIERVKRWDTCATLVELYLYVMCLCAAVMNYICCLCRASPSRVPVIQPPNYAVFYARPIQTHAVERTAQHSTDCQLHRHDTCAYLFFALNYRTGLE